MRKPDQELTKAYALHKFSKQYQAPERAQRRYESAFQRKISSTQQANQEFMSLLDSQAKEWWDSRITKGTGVDW